MKRFIQFVKEADVSSVKVGDTNITADKKANTVNISAKVGDNTTVTANRDLNTGGSSSIGVDTKIGDVVLSARQRTASYNKGQMGDTSSVSATYNDPTNATKHNITVDKGIGFGGAGKDVQPNKNYITTYRKNGVNVATKVGG